MPNTPSPAALSLPSGGGGIRGIGETFDTNPFTGTGSFSIPIELSQARHQFGPRLSLAYDTGNGNGIFGVGWRLSIPRISRKTEKGLPRYDGEDIFVLSGTEDLMPCLEADPGNGSLKTVSFPRGSYTVTRWRPRTEADFVRIEKWVRSDGDIHWRSVSRENVTSLYGFRSGARVSDPCDSSRIYEWYLEETFDAKGNHILYTYARESAATAALYPRRIYYGTHRTSSGPRRTGVDHADPLAARQRRYVFEAVFDYGDLAVAPADPYKAAPAGQGKEFLPMAPERADAILSHRPGFALNITRRCERILMFHHFAELGGPTLVQSTDFVYANDPYNRFSFLMSAGVSGYVKAASQYLAKRRPPVSLSYSSFEPDKQKYQNVKARCGYLPAGGFGSGNPVWADVLGNALPDVLEIRPEGFRFWANEGSANLNLPRFMDQTPAGYNLDQPGVRLTDSDGNGALDLEVSSPLAGFFQTDGIGGFKAFKKYEQVASVAYPDPAMRYVDLTGDGLADILMTRDHHFLWCESLGEKGYAPARMVERIYDSDQFPDVYFDDPQGRLRLADMTGDGLADMVLLHDGRIEYWPNRGYGRFGPRRVMKTPPSIGADFDPKRFFLVDLDGSGCADIVYVRHGSVSFWSNQCGIGWSGERIIYGTPPATDSDDLQFIDLFGTGTSVLVFSYDRSRYPGENIKVLDFCGGKKPYLLTGMSNNMGAETRVEYGSSTAHYLSDAAQGRPWFTKLPFPVHVVDRVENFDHLSGRRMVTRWRYHHGYYDGREREFRGFGCVDRLDSEDFSSAAAASDVPPVLTKTWYHTGVYFDGTELAERFRTEYYGKDPAAFSLPPHDVQGAATPDEAYRALRGSVLRTEVYAMDGSSKEEHPFTVTEMNYEVSLIQPPNTGAGVAAADVASRAVYRVHAKETLNFNYERHPQDPRIGHQLALEHDAFGGVTKSAVIGYPRRHPAYPEQSQTLITFVESHFHNIPDQTHFYLIGAGLGVDTYEITGLGVQPPQLLTAAEIKTAFANASAISFGASPTLGVVEKRLIESSRSLYYKSDLSGPLPWGSVDPPALAYETYRMAFTPQMLQTAYGSDVTASFLQGDGGYVFMNGVWWCPSGREVFNPARFYLAEGFVSPKGALFQAAFDRYDLLLERTEDPLGNVRLSANDYRVLQSTEITGPNGNRVQAAYDALGYLAATAVMGKPGENLGDSLQGIDPNPDPSVINQYYQDPVTHTRALLQQATKRFVYDLWRFANHGDPNFVASMMRETHAASPGGALTEISLGFVYSDGFARILQTKNRAENNRWIATGRMVFNNKGKTVKEFEPFFSVTHAFEDAGARGVSPTRFYDALDRVVAVLHPNHTYEKTVFDAWKQTFWDVNDTVLLHDPAADPDAGAFFSRLAAGQYSPTWYQRRNHGQMGAAEQNAAIKASRHADTPEEKHFDVMGRVFLALHDNGTAGKVSNRITLDIQGNDRVVQDGRGIEVFRHRFDMLSRKTVLESTEAGRRAFLQDAAGEIIFTADARGIRITTHRDLLNRPLEVWAAKAGGTSWLTEKTVYGESLGAAAAGAYLREKVWEVYDQAGLLRSEAYDFKGNLTHGKRMLLKSHKVEVDWNAVLPVVMLDPKTFEFTARFDALGRIAERRTADGSLFYHAYNERGLLKSVSAAFRGQTTPSPVVSAIEYNEKRLKTKIKYANGTTVRKFYDPETFLLTRTEARKSAAVFQDCRYTYDPAGNVTDVSDHAAQTVYFRNQVVSASSSYEYDALYRLICAEGREHGGQLASGQRGPENFPNMDLPHANNLQALRRYIEQYQYDEAGNLTSSVHQVPGRTQHSWTRKYQTHALHNRLTATSLPGDSTGQFSAAYSYDMNGQMTAMPHLTSMTWDFAARLSGADRGSSGRVFYQYDASGQRVRKVMEDASGTKLTERIYSDGFEIYREFSGGSIQMERETLHVTAEKERCALVETKTVENAAAVAAPAPGIRFQLSDLTGSACIETDVSGAVLSYEAYYPFGGTSYRSWRMSSALPPKRYRYSGKECDDETGFYYFGARYYAPWLGRWISPDPLWDTDGLNLYAFTRNNPVNLVDPDGRMAFSRTQEEAQTAADALQKDVVKKQGKLSVEEYFDYVEVKGKIWGTNIEKRSVGYRINIQLNEELPSSAENGSRTAAELLDMVFNDPYLRVAVYGVDKVPAAGDDQQIKMVDLCGKFGCGSTKPAEFGNPAVVFFEPNPETYKDHPVPIQPWDAENKEYGLASGWIENKQGIVLAHEILGHGYGFAADIDGDYSAIREQDFALLVEDTIRAELGLQQQRPVKPANYNNRVGIEDLKSWRKGMTFPKNWLERNPCGKGWLERIYQSDLYNKDGIYIKK